MKSRRTPQVLSRPPDTTEAAWRESQKNEQPPFTMMESTALASTLTRGTQRSMWSLLTVSLLSQSPEAWRLTWRAPETCTSVDQLVRSVEARVGQPVFREPADHFIEGDVTAQNGGWLARLVVTDAKGTPLGQREVVTTEPGCPTLDARLTLVLSLLIDPAGSLRARPMVTTPAPTPRLPAAPLETPRALSPEDLVRLTLESDDRDVHLFEERTGRASGTQQSWTGTIDVCGVPCGASVPRGAKLIIGGPDVLPATFTLAGIRTTSAVVSVKASSLARQVWSVLGLTFGVALTALGVAGLAVSSSGASALQAVSATGALLGVALSVLSGVGLSQGPTVVTVR